MNDFVRGEKRNTRSGGNSNHLPGPVDSARSIRGTGHKANPRLPPTGLVWQARRPATTHARVLSGPHRSTRLPDPATGAAASAAKSSTGCDAIAPRPTWRSGRYRCRTLRPCSAMPSKALSTGPACAGLARRLASGAAARSGDPGRRVAGRRTEVATHLLMDGEIDDTAIARQPARHARPRSSHALPASIVAATVPYGSLTREATRGPRRVNCFTFHVYIACAFASTAHRAMIAS